MQARIKGFVVGSDEIQGRTVWKVRVKDGASEFNGQKFSVAEGQEKSFFAKGLDVTFMLGQFQGERGQAVRRAVDVQLFTEAKEEEPAAVRKTGVTQDRDALNILVTRHLGKLNAYFTGLETLAEAVEYFLAEVGPEDGEEIVCFIPFNVYDWTRESGDPETVNGFEAIRSLIGVSSVRDALESILTAIIRTYADNTATSKG